MEAAEIPPVEQITLANVVPTFQAGGGMLRSHDLERHVNTYTLTDSDMDLMESAGPAVEFCIALASFFGSTAITSYLAGVTIPQAQWTPRQWGMFYYGASTCLVIAAAAAIFGVVQFRRRSAARRRVKKESFAPGTYVAPVLK
jgi:hypothetical protein